ncbi:unnamed protein product [Xylocopa violacea]|uniref:Uncharacterized protein n=1 Tax=Xylocopa violacea TaxID=135666 RepID=A0ABP1P4S1_XYLVO
MDSGDEQETKSQDISLKKRSINDSIEGDMNCIREAPTSNWKRKRKENIYSNSHKGWTKQGTPRINASELQVAGKETIDKLCPPWVQENTEIAADAPINEFVDNPFNFLELNAAIEGTKNKEYNMLKHMLTNS